MKNSINYIASGILELYVLGLATQHENEEVQEMIRLYETVKTEVEHISIALQQYAGTKLIKPGPAIKASIFSIINNRNPELN